MAIQLGCVTRPWNSFTWEEFLAGAAGASYECIGTTRHAGEWIVADEVPVEVIKRRRAEVEEAGLLPSTCWGGFPLDAGPEAAEEGLGLLAVRVEVEGGEATGLTRDSAFARRQPVPAPFVENLPHPFFRFEGGRHRGKGFRESVGDPQRFDMHVEIDRFPLQVRRERIDIRFERICGLAHQQIVVFEHGRKLPENEQVVFRGQHAPQSRRRVIPERDPSVARRRVGLGVEQRRTQDLAVGFASFGAGQQRPRHRGIFLHPEPTNEEERSDYPISH